MRAVKFLFRLIFIFFILFFMAYMVAYMTYNNPGKVATTTKTDTTISHIVIDNLKLHAETFGSNANQAIIVLHGGPGLDYKYMLPLRALSDEYFMVFYDQRGHGRSPRVEMDSLSLDLFTTELEGVIAHYKLSKPHIIAHSSGSQIALNYLNRHPEKIGKMVLANTEYLNEAQFNLFMENTNGFLTDFSGNSLGFVLKEVFKHFHVEGPDAFAKRDYLFQAYYNSGRNDSPLAGYFCDSGEIVDIWRGSSFAAQNIFSWAIDDQGKYVGDFVKNAASYNKETLLLGGTCNKIIDRESLELQANELGKRVELKMIENAGQYIFTDNPRATNKTVRAFLNR